ncbi:hypothetical protein B7P43_G16189 [Cryptotermes secundus]|uniref:Uncharacterized protein n=1 Tax=Cryptotermes secundus TaxID=105785 RepID=A0A2J7PVA8_9NEOP|nr:uncharacterized protein LOC111871584 [Cryptotermes secundus]PNF20240.1 hypothetical protein B7P43_G16189 [Cryptotermes secundus]
MCTLTWTVWLLLALTALAINVEVEAVPDHETDVAGGKQHSGNNGGHDHIYGDKQGHSHKKELSKDQKIILQKIFNYLKMADYMWVTGEFTFIEQRIPVDFILTVLYIEGKSIRSIQVEDLWEIIQLYGDYEMKAESEPPNRGMSKYEQVLMLYVQAYVKRNKEWRRSRIYTGGSTVPVLAVSDRLKETSRDILTATTEELLKVTKEYARKHRVYIPYTPVTQNPSYLDIHKVNAIMDFLKTQGPNATGSFTVSKYRISIEYILWNLAKNGKSVKSLKSDELWNIIRAYVRETKIFDALPEKEKAVLRDILNYVQLLGDGARGEVTFKSHKLSIDFIMTVVHLQGADIYSLTVVDLWELMKMYEVYEKKLGSEPQNRNISKYEQVTLLYAITYLRNDAGFTGQIVIDGVKIPVSYILKQLKIFGKDIRTATMEQIHIITSAYLKKYTPPTRVPLGTQPTEEQTLELRALIDLLKTQRSPTVGSFIFSGYRTSVQFILSYMAQHGLSIDKLSIKELWSIMLLHESNETNTATAVSAGPGSGKTTTRIKICGTVTETHVNDTLHKIVDELFSEVKMRLDTYNSGGKIFLCNSQ